MEGNDQEVVEKEKAEKWMGLGCYSGKKRGFSWTIFGVLPPLMYR